MLAERYNMSTDQAFKLSASHQVQPFCVWRRRLSDLALAEKKITHQARPLTVVEVKRLHSFAADPSVNKVDRVIASHTRNMAVADRAGSL